MAVQPNQQFTMDPPSQISFVRYFTNLPEKSNSTIRFFNRGDYYTLHGSDALFAAKEIFKTTSVCKILGAEPYKTEGVVLNKGHFEAFIRDLLLVKQYRVEIYMNQGSAKNQNWTLEYKGSPGNLSQFEDILFANNDIALGVSVIAIKLGTEGKSKIVGLSRLDTVANAFSVCEFQDSESFSNLESFIVTLNPKECLLVQGESNYEFDNLKQVIERSNVLVTLRKKSEFSNDSVVQDLNTLLKFKKGQQQNVQSLPEVNLTLAMSATSALIKYLDLTSDEGNIHQFSIEQIKQSRYLKLDTAAIKALNIEHRLDVCSNLNGNVPESILTLLDKCKTPQGHRLIAQWIRQPLNDLTLIKERHDIVEALVKSNELRSALSEDHLKRIPDLQQLAKKLSRRKAHLQDCYKIYMSVSHLPRLIQQLDDVSNVIALKALIIDPLKELIKDMDKFQQMIEQTIDLDAAEKGDFLVHPDFDDELKELKEEMNEMEKKVQLQLSKVAEDLDVESGKSLKLETNQQLGYYFRITLKEEKILRNKKHYTILDSNKNGVRFRNNKLNELNDEYIAAREKYTSQQKTVVTEIIEIAAGYTNSIKSIGDVIACLDVFVAFALTAANAHITYTRPEMLPSEHGELNLVQVRHPCLEVQEGIDYIANDVYFKKDEVHCYIITGPNMGGKSTYIRSAGVTALMAHIGSFVPCEKAKISLLDCILARIGADDSQLKGLSTFMMEMIETAAILRTATPNSLVIIDELGRGTSTYEGCGIAWSIAEHLAKEIKSYCLFATHFHEITRLSEEIPTVKNQHVTALVQNDKLTLLYKVKPGVCDQSFGIHVAKMANFPDNVIEFAKRKQTELEDYQGTIFEGFSSPQKRRKIIKKADELITEFLNECRTVDKSLSDRQLKDKIFEHKTKISSHKNPYIDALLSEDLKRKWLQLLSQVEFQFPVIKQLQSYSVNFKEMCYRLHVIITLGENVQFPKCCNCNEYTCKKHCVEELNAKVIIEIGNKYTWAITPFDCMRRHFSIFALPTDFSKEHNEEEEEEVLIPNKQRSNTCLINKEKTLARKLKLFESYNTELPTTRLFYLVCNPFNLFKENKRLIKLHSYLSFIKSNSIYQKLINDYCTDTVKILNIPNIEVFSPAKALLNSGTFVVLKIFLDHLFHQMGLTVILRKPNAVLMFCEPLAIHPASRKQLLHYLFQEVKVARVCLVPKPLAVCAILDIETCIVVDSGALNTTVAVVIDGRVVPHRWKLLPVGGWHVAYHLKQAMHWKRKEYHQIPVSFLDTLAVKKRCRLSYNIKNEEREGVEKVKEDINLRVDGCNGFKQFGHITFEEQIRPTYEKVSLGSELYIAPEMMYISLGLPKVIKEVTSGLSEDTMHDCFSHILLIGGNTDLSGFKSRLTKDLRELLPEYSEIFEIRNCPGTHGWNVAMGSTHVSLATHPDKMPPEYVEGYPFWLSREEYVLFGCSSLG